MTPRVTNAHLEARHREILAAGFRCLSRGGLHGTTMQEIAAEAGLSVGTLYRYFEDKEALVRALAARGARRRLETADALETGPVVGRLADAVCRLIDDLDSSEALASARLDVRLWGELLDRPEDRTLVTEVFESLRDLATGLARAQREAAGSEMKQHPETVGRIVLSLLTGLELQLAYEPELDLESYRDAVRAFLSHL